MEAFREHECIEYLLLPRKEALKKGHHVLEQVLKQVLVCALRCAMSFFVEMIRVHNIDHVLVSSSFSHPASVSWDIKWRPLRC